MWNYQLSYLGIGHEKQVNIIKVKYILCLRTKYPYSTHIFLRWPVLHTRHVNYSLCLTSNKFSWSCTRASRISFRASDHSTSKERLTSRPSTAMHVWELASVAAAQRRTRSSNLDRTAVLFPSAACCTQTPPKRRCFLQQPHSTFQKMPEVKRTDSSFSASQRTHVWLTANHKQLTATPYRYHIMLIVRTCKLQQSHQQKHQLNVTAHALLWWQEILWTSRTHDWKLTTFRVNWKKTTIWSEV